jgi:hypothetical protein
MARIVVGVGEHGHRQSRIIDRASSMGIDFDKRPTQKKSFAGVVGLRWGIRFEQRRNSFYEQKITTPPC